MVVNVTIPAASSGQGSVVLRALVDNGAQINLINQRAVLENDIPVFVMPGRPTAKLLNDNQMTIHKPHRLKTSVMDDQDNAKESTQTFWGGSFKEYDMILGWDWLQDTNPSISWRHGTFFWNPTDGQIQQ